MTDSPMGQGTGRSERSITSRDELRAAARDLLDALPTHDNHATVVALHGELGAGKTTFVQDIADLLGVASRVTSPTFVIMKSYDTARGNFVRLTHIDAYRVEEERELAPLRLDEVFVSPKTLVCIEWAERLGGVLPADAAHLSFSLTSDGARTLTYGKKS